MQIGLGIGIPFTKSQVWLVVQAVFTPASLFTPGVNGVWYDPSSITTLFQDAAGTTPVTAVEQPVGLMLDKSKGLVLGPVVNTTTNVNAVPIGGPAVSTYAVGGTITIGIWYEVTFTVSGYSGSSTVGFGSTTFNATNSTVTADGTYKFLAAAVATRVPTIFSRDTNTAVFSNISIRELPGNHAFQSTSANRPTLSARYNLLTKTQQFDDAYWAKNGLNSFGNGSIANTITVADPLEGNTADFICENLSAAAHAISRDLSGSLLPNVVYKASVCIGKYGALNSRQFAYVAFLIGNGTNSASRYVINIDLQTGQATDSKIGANVQNTSYISESVGNYWRVSLTASASSTNYSYIVIGVSDSATPTYNSYADVVYTGDGTSGIYIWGADIRSNNDALSQPAYQRVNTSTDYDTAGFKPYLRFNGTSSSMQTNSIDFTATDKMLVSAGVRKLSDAAIGQVLGLTNSISANNGAFILAAPGAAAANLAWSAKGTVQVDLTSMTYVAPITSVVSGTADISWPSTIHRINGLQTSSSTSSLGTGNFSNAAIYIGAIAGTSSWFNGRLYQLVVAGKQTSASEITNTETFINQKTGAY